MTVPSLLTPFRRLLTAAVGVYAAFTPDQRAALDRLLRLGVNWLAADGLPALLSGMGGALARSLTDDPRLAALVAQALARGTLAGVEAAFTTPPEDHS